MASTKQVRPSARMWLTGHEAGYRDAVAQLWEMEHEAFAARDEARVALLREITNEVQARMARTLERQQQIIEEEQRILNEG